MAQDTIAKLFEMACETGGDGQAIQQKDHGIWQAYSWREFHQIVKHFSLGLTSLGLQRDDKVTIIGAPEVEWVFAALAVMCARGIFTGAYEDSLAPEIEYVVNQSDSVFVVVEDQEQVDKVLEIKDKIPEVRKVIYWDPKGMRHYDDPILLRFDEVLSMGNDYDRMHPGLFEENIENGQPEDICGIFYTSGTTGNPKGVTFTYKAMMVLLNTWRAVAHPCKGDNYLAMYPLAWPVDLLNGVFVSFVDGILVSFPEEPQTAMENFREIAPAKMMVVPRMLDGQVSAVQMKIRDSSFIKKLAYALFLPVGYKMARLKFRNETPNLTWRILNALGNLVVFRPLRDQLGYAKSRFVAVGGAAVSEETFTFFHAIGVNLRNLYGLLECTYDTFAMTDQFDSEGAGVPSPFGTEIRIDDEGEILLRGPQRMVGYYKMPEATAKTIDEQGWTHSGDAGYIRGDGQLVCIDRVADLMKLSDGYPFSPQYLENKLKFSPYIRDGVIVGGQEEFIGALISIDQPNVSKWAETNFIPFTTFADISQKPEVYQLIRQELAKVNERLIEKQRIRRFALLTKELDADDAELTRSRKLRRGFVAEKYVDLVESLYAGKREHASRLEVTYRDGRKETLATTTRIADVGEDAVD